MKRALLLLALVVASCSDQPMPKVGDDVSVYGFDNDQRHLGEVAEVRGTWVRLRVIHNVFDDHGNSFNRDEDHRYWVDVSRFPAIKILPGDQ